MSLTWYWSSESMTALLPSDRTSVTCFKIGYIQRAI